MNRVWLQSLVNEAHHRLSSFLDHEGGTRRDTIVTNKVGRTKVRVNLLCERLDFNLKVLDRVAGDGISCSPR
jgi:hypothetical protein